MAGTRSHLEEEWSITVAKQFLRVTGKTYVWGEPLLGFAPQRRVAHADLARFAKSFPDHKRIEFPNASHFFFEDEADQMIPQIKAFMTSPMDGPGGAASTAGR